MSNHSAAQFVSAAVRAELARKQKTAGDMARLLGITPHTAGRRLNGSVDFTVVDLLQLSAWLDVPMAVFFAHAEPAASAS